MRAIGGVGKDSTWYYNKNLAHAGRMRTADGDELAGPSPPASQVDSGIVSIPLLQSRPSSPRTGLSPRAGKHSGLDLAPSSQRWRERVRVCCLFCSSSAVG